MYAVIQTGGKQYRVSKGDVIIVEKLDAKVGETVKLDCLLISDNGKTEIGNPLLNTSVDAKVLEHGKGDKVIIFKYKPKKDYRKKQGHRQPFTKLEITGLKATGSKGSATTEKKANPATKKAETKARTSTNEVIKVSMSMNKDELLEVAKKNGIKVASKATKADIIEAINANTK